MDHQDSNNCQIADGKGQSQEQQQNTFRLNIDRPLYEHENLRQNYQYEKTRIKVSDRVKNVISSRKCDARALAKTIPSIQWLRKYNWKDDFLADLTCGITMAIVQIPLGLACALLGHLPPIHGVYMAFFPVLIYSFLGTSHHVSIGAFAVTALMTGKTVVLYAAPEFLDPEVANNVTDAFNQSSGGETSFYTPVQVATAVTFMVGFIQLVMCVFRLGIIASLFSETFVNGFTTASAVHVILSLINDVLGINLPIQKGYFKLVRISISLCNEIQNTNLVAVAISVISMAVLVINNEIIKPWVEKRSRIPVPMETIVVVIGTAVTYYCNLAADHGIMVTGELPTGLPDFSLPAFDLLPNIIVDGISIAMVCFTITMSMGMMFAQKVGYKIDSNQELFALGWSNVFGSFLACMPVSAALGRSIIQFTTGGKTQLTSIISCVLILFVLLWIGPLFEFLPRAILASIIIVSLKGLILQMREFKKFWKLSKYDAMIWFLTFISTVIVGIDIGLLTGLIASIASILMQSVKPSTCILGQVPNTELFLDVNRYKGALELDRIKIFHYSGSLNFINGKGLKSKLCKAIGVVPERVLKERTKMANQEIQPSANSDSLRYIILDMSSVTFVDPTGVLALRSIASEFLRIDVTIYLAGCSATVFELIKKCDMFEKNEPSFHTFATVLDAVCFCQKKQNCI